MTASVVLLNPCRNTKKPTYFAPHRLSVTPSPFESLSRPDPIVPRIMASGIALSQIRHTKRL